MPVRRRWELAAAVRADEGELVAGIRIPHGHIEEAESLLARAGDPAAPTPSQENDMMMRRRRPLLRGALVAGSGDMAGRNVARSAAKAKLLGT